MPGAICNIERGCGRRESNGLYLEVGVSENGLPLENFILDPPIPIPDDMDITPLGVKLFPARDPETGEEVWHVADWIGSDNYPNVWDFFGEARLFGVSRKLSPDLDYSKLTKKSRWIPCHAHAIVENQVEFVGHDYGVFGDYVTATSEGVLADNQPQNWVNAKKDQPHGAKWRAGEELRGGWKCLKALPEHEAPYQFHGYGRLCSGIWGQTVEGGEPLGKTHIDEIISVDGQVYYADDPRLVVRIMPSFRYIARCAPEGVSQVMKPGFIGSFPISQLVIIEGQLAQERLTAASKSSLPVKIVQE